MTLAGYRIFKRTKGGKQLSSWQVRVYVPADLQKRLGIADVVRSLKTSDDRLAERRALKAVEQFEQEWAALDTSEVQASAAPPVAVTPSQLQMVTAATECAFDVIEGSMSRSKRRAEAMSDGAAYADYLAALQARILDLVRTQRAAARPSFEGIADKHIAAQNWILPKGSPPYETFVDMIAEAAIDALKVTHERDSGSLSAEPTSRVVRAAKEALSQNAKPGETIMDLFERWGDDMLSKGQKRPDTINQDRKVIQQFADFVGVGRAIESITPVEVAEYRDTLRDLPPKWMSKRELRGLNMRTAALRARESEMPRTAYTNVNKHLSTISPLYKWLAAHPRWAGLRNPCDGLFHKGVKGKNKRPPFTTEAMNKMLCSPLFVGFQADGKEHLEGTVRADDWRFWVPLACMFTGARIGEMAQLKIRDVSQERGVWFFHIRHDEDEGLSTKSGEARVAAVHPTLERLGFLHFHARQLERAGGDQYAALFPELEKNSRGQISGRASRWWRQYLARIGLKDPNAEGGDGKGSHSFRHTLADRLRSEAELLDNQVAICLGHSIKTTTAGYGTLSQGTVSMLKGWMDAVRFEGVSFDHLVKFASVSPSTT